MKTIYLDSDFKCHVLDNGTMRAIVTDEFDDKCDAYIEGYRFIPKGESWVRPDGMVFKGKMVTPWIPASELNEIQRDYKKQLLAEFESALIEIETALGV